MQNTPPKLVIFDCDGVLVDTEGPVNEVIAASLTRYGLPVSAHECQALFIGGTIFGVHDEAKRRGADLPDNWVDETLAAIFARIEAGVEVIDGVTTLLDQLDKKGIATAIASNGPMGKMERSLGPSGLWSRFEGRIYSREGFTPKPAPDMVLQALKDAGVDASEAVMIDDSASGCMAAVNAHVRAIGFAAEGQDDSLRAVGAEVVNHIDAIAELIHLP
ncbi:HAD family hydrolase [Halocynthiibacter namhaensis]|uniref:HAD family hydrolase n=1 Tax=Halocynthiibacter namhaensis TaxID=1290553 RepID=UPI00057961D9|nr:HAD family phosphatase [Halocynthiibacter namhaensis]